MFINFLILFQKLTQEMENQSSSEIKKNKILAFIEKDLFLINNFETAPFKNKNHAIECLIPYHIFSLTADDVKFRESDMEIDFKTELDSMKTKLIKMINEHSFDSDGFTPQLLLYHQQRYLNNNAYQVKPTKPSPTIKKRKSNEKSSLLIRIPRTDVFNVYGPIYKLGIGRFRETKMP